METKLADFIADTPAGQEAEAILRRCVHCGFCTATCPTYQILGDELDGPRGRIYLIKQMLEGGQTSRETMRHLDQCLTCRNCETTCPSGVQYGRLVDIGREVVEQRVSRPTVQKWTRVLLREGLTSSWFAPAFRLGQSVRGFLPKVLASKLPQVRPVGPLPQTAHHARQVIALKGCVQPTMVPTIDAAMARVLDRLGIGVVTPSAGGCCGAIRHHLADGQGALQDARRNIDAWWPLIAQGQAEAIVVNASGCGVMVKDYGHLLADDPAYADKAKRVSDLAKDPIELIEPMLGQLQEQLAQGQPSGVAASPTSASQVAYHPPCTQQHGLKIRGAVERVLQALGASCLPVADSHLCCGSAGTYSVLQPSLSAELKSRKLAALTAGKPQVILSANVGCITHLESGSDTPVRHWLEWLDERLQAATASRSTH
jgi:glycolate oxidase iron-sulfur subunit